MYFKKHKLFSAYPWGSSSLALCLPVIVFSSSGSVLWGPLYFHSITCAESLRIWSGREAQEVCHMTLPIAQTHLKGESFHFS